MGCNDFMGGGDPRICGDHMGCGEHALRRLRVFGLIGYNDPMGRNHILSCNGAITS